LKAHLATLVLTMVGCTTVPEMVQVDTVDAYAMALKVHVQKRWVRPQPVDDSVNCVVFLTQNSTGQVQSVDLGACNASPEESRAIKRAVWASSTLPLPANRTLFDPQLVLTFCPTCD
jgi:hypothetical protein